MRPYPGNSHQIKSWIRKHFDLLSLLAPSLLFLILFHVAPLVIALTYSFYRYVPPLIEYTFTVENYFQLAEPAYLTVIVRTLRISAISTLAALLLGYPVAYWIARSRRGKKIILTIVISMFFVSAVSRAYAWLTVFGRNGLVGLLFQNMGLEPPRLVFTELLTIIGSTHYMLPFMILILVGSIQNIDPLLENAASSLGANPQQTFFKVTLPLSLPGVASAALLSLTIGFGLFITPVVLGGGFSDLTANFVFNQTVAGNNVPLGSAAAIVTILLAVLAATLANSVLEAKQRSRWT